jgi:hypothetical protein
MRRFLPASIALLAVISPRMPSCRRVSEHKATCAQSSGYALAVRAWLQMEITETAVVEKPADEDEQGHGHHHGHAH